jgi:glucosamine--fructose-6-phosphate aminotransferase (isomerizing)
MRANREEKNALWQDIQAQPENLARVVQHLYGPERPRLDAAASFLRNEKPILFLGMGSAVYLCTSPAVYLGAHGRFASTTYASDGLHTLLPSLNRVNVVLNSRSGETVEVVQLSQALQGAGVPFLLITNEPDSTAAQAATHVLWSNSRKDDLVSINIATAMMATTLILAAEVLGQRAIVRRELDGLAAGLAAAVEKGAQHAGAMADLLGSGRPIYLLYRGMSASAALCSQLVIEEVARWPAVSIDAAMFRQGPIEVVDADFRGILFASPDRLGQLDLALQRDIGSVGGRLLLVASAGEGLPPGHGTIACPLPPVHPLFRPVFEVIPAQLLAYELAARQGIEPGTVRYLSKVITTEAGIPRKEG